MAQNTICFLQYVQYCKPAPCIEHISVCNQYSTPNSFLRFAYFCVCPLCSAKTIGAAIDTPLTGPVQERKLKSANISSLAWQMRTAVPMYSIGTVNQPHFSYKSRMKHCANNITCAFYLAPIFGAMSLILLHLFFQNMPIKGIVSRD
jgi:hypothetical protein